MKRMRFAVIVSLMTFVLPFLAHGQEIIRHNYKVDGYQYVGTERTLVKGGSSDKHPFLEKLDYIVFPDGESTAYILEIAYEEEKNFNFPKEVEMRATTMDGKIHRFKQYAGTSTDKHQFTAADGKSKVYWNVGKYMLEESDVAILCSGVKNLEVVYSWAPDGFYTHRYDKNEFSSALKSQVELIKSGLSDTVEIGDIADYVDNQGSTTVIATPIAVQTDPVSFKMQMTYLYYKSTNTEDYDLTMAVLDADGNPLSVPYEAELEFSFEDGTSFNLMQEREAEGVVYMFPSIDQAKKLAYGNLVSVKIPLENGSRTQKFNDNEFGKACRILYNTLQAVSVL